MRRSLTKQILVIISGLVACAILICILLNATVLEKVYTREKIQTLRSGYEQLSDASAQGILAEDSYDTAFSNLTSGGNLHVIILDPDGSIVRSSENNTTDMRKDFSDILFSSSIIKQAEKIDDTDHYTVLRSHNERLDETHLILWGTLDGGQLCMIQTPVSSIKSSVRISNRFFLIVGILVILASVLIAALISRRITRPIQMLTDISQEMADLNFEAKYRHGAWKEKEWKREHARRIREKTARTAAGDFSVAKGNEVDQLGEHINQLSSHLKQTISELKSANAKLTQDIEKKTRIDEMRKEFLANVSHELKTPIALIQGYAEGLKECINEDEDSRNFYCEVIMDEAGKMNHMVKQLLDLNQLEFGDQKVTMERFDLSELIRGVSESTMLLAKQAGITVDLDIAPDVYVWGEEFSIEEVVTNYLSNAYNHCDYEKKIRIYYTEMPGDILRVSVFNTGDPIPEEDLAHIWDKFYKVDKARTRAYGGSGIGLSIVAAVMTSIGQQYGAENKENGVEFWFELSRK